MPKQALPDDAAVLNPPKLGKEQIRQLELDAWLAEVLQRGAGVFMYEELKTKACGALAIELASWVHRQLYQAVLNRELIGPIVLQLHKAGVPIPPDVLEREQAADQAEKTLSASDIHEEAQWKVHERWIIVNGVRHVVERPFISYEYLLMIVRRNAGATVTWRNPNTGVSGELLKGQSVHLSEPYGHIFNVIMTNRA